MTKLSVNINKVATLRNARGKNNPDVLQTAMDLISYGAQGITVHPRPDERHIRRSDVFALKEFVSVDKNVEFNIEGYPSEDFIELIRTIRPEQTTLVPDPPEVITSNAGWNVSQQLPLLSKIVPQLIATGTRISVFIDPFHCTEKDLLNLQKLGVHRIELFTERYAETFGTLEQLEVVNEYVRCAQSAVEVGLGLNAGHDLDSKNLHTLVSYIPQLAEVSIGHALIADALHWGYKKTIEVYLDALKPKFLA